VRPREGSARIHVGDALPKRGPMSKSRLGKPSRREPAAPRQAPLPQVTNHCGTLYHALRSELGGPLQSLGLSMPQLALLDLLKRVPAASNAKLAKAAFVSAQTTWVTLRGLEDQGLVARSGDPKGAPGLLVKLTGEGDRALRLADGEVAKVEQRLLEALSREEALLLRALLERCASALLAQATNDERAR
jgi:DNA-binding MarR family transcriptional regulator